MMKALVIALTLFTSLLTACDRQTLDGLRLRLQADIKSDYDQNQDRQATNSREESHQAASEPGAKAESTSEQSVRQVEASSAVEATSDPDAPLPFSPLKNCSQGDIIAQTNERFYQRHPGLKSVDSKNKQRLKEWKAIRAEVEQKCQQNQ